MSIRQTHFNFVLAESHSQLPQGITAAMATVATAQEAGVQAFYEGYYGKGAFGKILSECQANRAAAEKVGQIQEAALSDVGPLLRFQNKISNFGTAQESTHMSSDFQLTLASVRDRVVRNTFSPTESNLFAIATEREVTDFKPIKGIRYGTIDRLKLRPEGTDVKYTTLSQTEDGYVVANYERALGFTWEAYTNDDLSIFTNGMAELGRAALRNRILVVLEAIDKGLTAANYDGAAGGPTPSRVKAVIQAIAKINNGDGMNAGLRATKALLPVLWEEDAIATFTSDTVQAANGSTTKNTMKGRLDYTIERLMARVLNNDWIVYDDTIKWLEIAYLTGFKAGPKTYTKAPDTIEHLDEGTFKNHTFDVKCGDVVGAKVVELDGVKRIAGGN